MKKSFLESNQKLKRITVEQNYFMKKNYSRIGVNTNDDVPLNKPLKFLTLTIIIRCVFQMGEILHLSIYLDQSLYEPVQMLEYNRKCISEGININKTNKSKECILCYYWYFLDKNFSYGPDLCDGCFNIMQKSIDFKNTAIVYVKGSIYRIHFWYMSKRKAISLITNFKLIDKKGVL